MPIRIYPTEVFPTMVSIIGIICGTFIVLVVFLVVMVYLRLIIVKWLFKEPASERFPARETLVTVHLMKGEPLREVRFIGFAHFGGNGPSRMSVLVASKMAVFEKPDGGRIYIRHHLIESIEELKSSMLLKNGNEISLESL